MSEKRGPRRSERIIKAKELIAERKRQQSAGDEPQPKRMKSGASSRALTTAESFEARLHQVFSFRAAIPVLNKYLASIQIDDDDPGFLFDWEIDNLSEFILAMNILEPADAPAWMRTRPPQVTVQSFTNELIQKLEPAAGGRCGRVLLAPNRPDQFGAIGATLVALQNDDFLQEAAQLALPVVNNVEKYLATTYYLTDTKAQRSQLNNLPPNLRNGQPLRRLFI